MIPKRQLLKKIRTTRTRKFKIINSDEIAKRYPCAQMILCLYFNGGLKYLYQHYGVSHLNDPFPTGIRRKYLIGRMINFSRRMAKIHKFNLKKLSFSMQSVDKTLESLCVNFIKYRKGQYKRIHYWSAKEAQRYLRRHDCQLSGYGRISFNDILAK